MFRVKDELVSHEPRHEQQDEHLALESGDFMVAVHVYEGVFHPRAIAVVSPLLESNGATLDAAKVLVVRGQ
ncbi:MAG: hypothetical protein ABL971_05225 [Vicinamibacterales bacterium]